MFVFVKTGEGVFEGPFDDNNIASAPTVVTNAPADFVVTSIVTPQEGFSGEPALIEWTVRNDGPAVWPGTAYWTDQVWISPDPVFLPGRALILGGHTHSNAEGLAGGESYTENAEFVLPRGIGGQYYIYVQTNIGGESRDATGDNNRSRESFRRRAFEDTSNNRDQAPIPVTFREPDLNVTDIALPVESPTSGQSVSIGWTTTNIGTRRTREIFWWDSVYLSADPSLDDGDQFLGRWQRGGVRGLDINASYSPTLNVVLPDGVEGDFYLLVFTDSNLVGAPPPGPPEIR